MARQKRIPKIDPAVLDIEVEIKEPVVEESITVPEPKVVAEKTDIIEFDGTKYRRLSANKDGSYDYISLDGTKGLTR